MGESEPDLVRARYARREDQCAHLKYDALLPHSLCFRQEKERAFVRLLRRLERDPGAVESLRVVEIGCGSGANLLDFLRLGFRPENLLGIELLEERAREARRILPEKTAVITGDAAELVLEDESFDICFQSTVFTSLLDQGFQEKLASRMWQLVKPGGGVLWYDFIYNNPGNPDVRGVPVGRVRQLFPHGRLTFRRITLAPPLARRVAKIHPGLYTCVNRVPFLRTHVLAWIGKTAFPQAETGSDA
ncbi:class I SAM-dependent methyltransferase [Gemmatimonadota bacterium]